MIEIQETYKNCLRIVVAEAAVSDEIPARTAKEEPNQALRKVLNESRTIEVTDQSARYEVAFDDYIAYAVTNESYAGGVEQAFEGRLVRAYSDSAFLHFIGQGTIATAEYPGPFVHYGFCCLNHVIDVVAETPPSVKLIDA